MSELTHIELSGTQTHDIQVDANQHVHLLLTYSSAKQFDSVFEFTIAKDARLTLYHVQNTFHDVQINHQFNVTQGKNSSVRVFDIAVGAQAAKNQFTVALEGEHAQCDMLGIFLSAERQKLSANITMMHNAPHTRSQQNYKGIANDQSTGEFFTRVVVKEGAQKIYSEQTSKNILLSNAATIRTQPELEIYADDVQCAHGATVGELDENALFYLRSRGIPLAEAKALMTYAFVAENIDQIDNAHVREMVLQAVLPKIPNAQTMDVTQ